MKVIKTKLLQKAKGRKIGKYELTLLVTDTDLEMMEDFATTMAAFEVFQEPCQSNNWEVKFSTNYKPKYQKWLMKLWRCFWKPWNKYERI